MGKIQAQSLTMNREQRRVWGPAVKARREELGWSQEQLAAEALTNRKTIGHIESGRTVPHEDLLRRVLAVLDLAPENAFIDDDVVAWLNTVAPLLQRLGKADRDRFMPVLVEYVAEELRRQKRLLGPDEQDVAG